MNWLPRRYIFTDQKQHSLQFLTVTSETSSRRSPVKGNAGAGKLLGGGSGGADREGYVVNQAFKSLRINILSYKQWRISIYRNVGVLFNRNSTPFNVGSITFRCFRIAYVS